MSSHLREWRSRSVSDNLLRANKRQTNILGTKIFAGATPFSERLLRAAESMLAITRGERPPRPTHPGLPDNLWTLIQQCWNQEARLRPHAWHIRYSLYASAFELNVHHAHLFLPQYRYSGVETFGQLYS